METAESATIRRSASGLFFLTYFATMCHFESVSLPGMKNLPAAAVHLTSSCCRFHQSLDVHVTGSRYSLAPSVRSVDPGLHDPS